MNKSKKNIGVGHPDFISVKLPDGSDFKTWEQQMSFNRIYHVAQNNPKAFDSNDGSREMPWKTISKAAEILMPGEKVVVHHGVYREWVKPVRGGTSPESMISYEAATGEEVVIKGSDIWKPVWEKTRYFNLDKDIVTWQADLSADLFEGANTFGLQNFTIQEDSATWKMFPTFDHRRGQIFVDGIQLTQVSSFSQLADGCGRFWVEENGMTIHVRLHEDAVPGTQVFEVTTREQVFAPVKRYLNYIHIKGFRMFHAANGVPIPPPQRGLLSSTAGHHWIIEDCEIGYANTLGMDLGGQWWSYGKGEKQGYHIIRRNHIHHCGVSSISAWHNMANENMLVEDNYITDNCIMPINNHCESAGIKIHRTENSVFRRNVILRTVNGPSLWLDGEIMNTRITQNLFVGVENSEWGMLFLEINLGTNLVDNNIFIKSGGHGFYEHDAEKVVLMQNLFMDIKDAAVYMAPGDPERTGRPYENHHRIYGNIFINSGRQVEVPNSTTKSDYNLFVINEARIKKNECPQMDNVKEFAAFKGFGLSAWRGKYSLAFSDWIDMGYDINSIIKKMQVEFCEDELSLIVKMLDNEVIPEFRSISDILPGMADSDVVLTEDFFGNKRHSSKFRIGPICNLDSDYGKMHIDPRREIYGVKK